MQVVKSKFYDILDVVGRYIPEKLKNADAWAMFFKRVIYILCFMWLCRLDHVIGSETGWIQYGMKNYTGVVIAIIILTAYSVKDFFKLPYFLWAVVFFIGRYIVLSKDLIPTDNLPRLEAVIWNVGIYGIVLIRFLYQFIVERKKPRMNWPVFAIWFVMLLGMVLIRWDRSWPKWFFFMFGCFYLTDFKEKDLSNLFVGMVEGIILGFFMVQGYACMHRPYDTLRYTGAYGNSNINALFYLFSYAAVLCKWYQMKLRKRPMLLRLPIILLCGVMYGLTFFTMGRTALIVMTIITVLFLIFQMASRRKRKLLEFLVDGVAIALAVVVCFEPTYNAIRYIPAKVDDPVYIEAEIQETKIHKGDPVDSEKYIELEEAIEYALERIFWFGDDNVTEVGNPLLRILFPVLQVSAAALDPGMDGDVWEEYDEVYVEPGTDENHPILGKEDYNDPIKVRMSIYRYYMEHIQWIGSREGVDNVWITTGYAAPHAHNLLLYIGGEFGWIIMGLFLLIILLLYHTIVNGMIEQKQGAKYYRLFVALAFATVCVGFGMLEIDWMYGQLPFTMFFLVQYVMYHKCKKPVEEPV